MKDSFLGYHPLVNFLYFAVILFYAMVLINPICLAISLVSAFLYLFYLDSKKTLRFNLIYMIPMIIVTAVVNPLFNHEGNTILAYFSTGNPLTLESIIYGLASAFLMASVILWFSCYTKVMTSDKFVYLFGRIIPSLSLVLSMTLRFIPKFSNQMQLVTESQRTIGRCNQKGTFVDKIKNSVTILSIMITWSLENAIETADSMKSRGYGLPNRTAFSIYKFDERDKNAIIWILFLTIFVTIGVVSDLFYFSYFPIIKTTPINPISICFYLAYLMLNITPILINKKEDYIWKKLQ